MKRIAKLAIVVTVFTVVSAYGQSRAEIEAKFGQPMNVYPVGGRVWMSPEYASDGTSVSHGFLSTAVFFHDDLSGE